MRDHIIPMKYAIAEFGNSVNPPRDRGYRRVSSQGAIAFSRLLQVGTRSLALLDVSKSARDRRILAFKVTQYAIAELVISYW
ncbi:hypothetical protein IQ249_20585 [Lusitaniella coriacea LEGE 07157]|uniref:Uncharacterized protein n=1 Tax=Lusitaniella coriacea LEGE 07157 TaxID=945747 RepID=A0A8J7E126_9CYAN|nr:hypothetical protein [Lusitaniella coriacea]MBE9118293.1 hypothetical protein [Lusitaniella coriacea LEGE 07157]